MKNYLLLKCHPKYFIEKINIIEYQNWWSSLEYKELISQMIQGSFSDNYVIIDGMCACEPEAFDYYIIVNNVIFWIFLFCYPVHSYWVTTSSLPHNIVSVCVSVCEQMLTQLLQSCCHHFSNRYAHSMLLLLGLSF